MAEGTSLDKAQEIADFLNDHVQYLAITRFGDVEDATRDVRLSEHKRQIDTERFIGVVTMLREKLQVNDVPGVLEALKAVESVSIDLSKGWSKAQPDVAEAP